MFAKKYYSRQTLNLAQDGTLNFFYIIHFFPITGYLAIMALDGGSFDVSGFVDLPRWLEVFLLLLLCIILFVLVLWLCWRFCSTPMPILLPGIEMQGAAPQVPWPDIDMELFAPEVTEPPQLV